MSEKPSEKAIRRKVAVPSKQKPRLLPRLDIPKGIQTYDYDNIYAQRVQNIIAASGTGSACAEVLKDHLRGRGFIDAVIENFVVNRRGETLGDIHNLICEDRSMLKGCILHIGYNAMFEKVSLSHVPIEMIRLSSSANNDIIDQFAFHKDWAGQYRLGGQFQKEKIKYIDIYNPDKEVIRNQVEKAGGFEKWNGQILFYSEKGHLAYPPAEIDSVLEDAQTDTGIKIWKMRGVKTGFSASHFLFFQGEFEDEDKRLEFEDSVNSLQGDDNAYKINVIECPTPESTPKFEKIETISADGIWKDTEESVRENIIRRYKQPSALHSIKSPGQLGMNKEWEEAKIYYDERTENTRNRLWMLLAQVMKDWSGGDPSGGDINKYKIIPITGFQPKSVKKTLSEFLRPEALAQCIEIVKMTELSSEQKVNLIVAMFPVERAIAETFVNTTTNVTP